MNVKKSRYLFVLYFVISLACNAVTGLPAGETPQELTTTVPPPVASGNGPQGLSAEATSSDSVMLTWQPVDGASSYHVAVSTNDGETLIVTDLAPSVTSYEDFLVAPDSQLTYVVEALGDTGSIGQSIASVTTPVRQSNPLQVLAQFDTTSSVTQKIGPSGGNISVVDASGVSYVLSIPPNALEEEVDVSLTPVADLSNWPLDGEMIGVIGIEPQGLVLNVPAYLTITPPSQIAADGLATVGFSFQGYGDEFTLQPLTSMQAVSSSIPGGSSRLASPVEQTTDGGSVLVTELKPKGVGQVSDERAKELVRQNLPSDSAAAMDQKQAVSSINDDELHPIYLFQWQIEFNNYHRKIQQVSDCRELRTALGYLVEAIHDADFGKDQTASRIEQENKAWDETIEKTKEVIDKAAEECKEKKSGEQKFTNGPCALGLIKSITSPASAFDKEFQKRMLEKNKDILVEGAKRIKDACSPGYNVSGSSDGVYFSGKICSLEAPFTINGVFPGGSAVTTFTPGNATSGVTEMSGGGGGCSQSGGGTYTVLIIPDGPGSLNWKDDATVDCPGESRTSGFTVALHRVEGACAK